MKNSTIMNDEEKVYNDELLNDDVKVYNQKSRNMELPKNGFRQLYMAQTYSIF